MLQTNGASDPDPLYYEPYISLNDAHFVYRYSGINIGELLQTDIYTFRTLLINAYVHEASKTKEGKQLLNRYHALYEEQSEEFDSSGLTDLLSCLN